MARSGPTESLACDQTRGDHPAKKTIALDTAPPLTQRKNSRFRAVNMLTGCPGIFAVFIFIIQFVVRKKC
ncbi:hypothetical protein ECDEC3F_3237 [Escherichia coli DEC3F]|nr:hypothetical protein ECDEC3F_3237 [Escherichia coli DEC3F]